MNEVNMCHLMIDMETYSTKSNAVFRSIAGVLFNLEGKTEGLFSLGVNIESALMAGLTIDEDTINFWRNQSEENRNKLVTMPATPLIDVLSLIEKGAKTEADDLSTMYVWSHGSNFDLVILENAYKAVGKKAWWKYSNVRDTRTLFDLANYTYKAKGGHDALEDALSQAVAVQEAYKQLTKGGDNGKD